jgi:hypothetical protein
MLRELDARPATPPAVGDRRTAAGFLRLPCPRPWTAAVRCNTTGAPAPGAGRGAQAVADPGGAWCCRTWLEEGGPSVAG